MKKFFYIAEINLPTSSAYALHVLKMCDAFAELKYDVRLIVYYKRKNLKFNVIKKKYNLKNNFKIETFFKSSKKYNFFDRCKLAFYANKIITDKDFIVSRSIISSIFLAFNKKINILEMHHALQGLTSIIFKYRNIFLNCKYLKFILLNKKLNKVLTIPKNQSIILDDAVDLRDFDKVKVNKNKLNGCVYTGSFIKGKGLEIIGELAKKNPDIKFNIYGDKKYINHENINYINKKNIKLYNFQDYSKIPKILKQNKILLMPYQDKVFGRGSNLELSKYMSPMKMFDYLAAGRIIIASDLKVYSHILKNNFNAFLVKSNEIKIWNSTLRMIYFSKKNIYNNISDNARRTVEKYTWIKRSHKIINFNKK